jgi:transcriptional regulator with XRE-family HTH domain
MSQTALGDAMGISFQQLQKYEAGSNRTSASRLYELSKLLDVDISYFFDEMDRATESESPARLMGTSKNDATDVKLSRSRGSRGSRAGAGVGVFGVLRLPGGSVPLSMRAPGKLLP